MAHCQQSWGYCPTLSICEIEHTVTRGPPLTDSSHSSVQQCNLTGTIPTQMFQMTKLKNRLYVLNQLIDSTLIRLAVRWRETTSNAPDRHWPAIAARTVLFVSVGIGVWHNSNRDCAPECVDAAVSALPYTPVCPSRVLQIHTKQRFFWSDSANASIDHELVSDKKPTHLRQSAHNNTGFQYHAKRPNGSELLRKHMCLCIYVSHFL